MYKDPDKQREAILKEGKDIEQIAGVDTCLGCNKAIIHTVGKKKKKWCSDACRMATKRRSNPNINNEQIKSEQGVTQGVTKTEAERYIAALDRNVKNVIPDHPVPVIPKRGKDIKCSADLHPGIQQTINNLSLVDGKIDQTIKANRTAIAVNYQHLFPDRYYPTGVAI